MAEVAEGAPQVAAEEDQAARAGRAAGPAAAGHRLAGPEAADTGPGGT